MTVICVTPAFEVQAVGMTVAFVVPVAAMYAALAHVDDPPAALSDTVKV